MKLVECREDGLVSVVFHLSYQADMNNPSSGILGRVKAGINVLGKYDVELAARLTKLEVGSRTQFVTRAYVSGNHDDQIQRLALKPHLVCLHRPPKGESGIRASLQQLKSELVFRSF